MFNSNYSPSTVTIAVTDSGRTDGRTDMYGSAPYFVQLNNAQTNEKLYRLYSSSSIQHTNAIIVLLLACRFSHTPERTFLRLQPPLLKMYVEEVLRAVVASLPVGPRVKRFVLDFESGLWQALRSVFVSTNVCIRGCNFHWAQAVWRKVQELGLQVCFHFSAQTLDK